VDKSDHDSINRLNRKLTKKFFFYLLDFTTLGTRITLTYPSNLSHQLFRLALVNDLI
jgi:hypothetical protein